MNNKLNIEKEVDANKVWESNKMNRLRKFILSESKKQSKKRKRRNEFLSVKFNKEDNGE